MRFVKAVLTFVSRAEGLVVSWTSGYPSRFNNFIVSCAEGGKPPSSSPGTTSAPPTAGARGSVACVIPRDQLRTRILYTVYMEYTTIHMLLEFGQLVERQYQFRQDVATSVWLTHNLCGQPTFQWLVHVEAHVKSGFFSLPLCAFWVASLHPVPELEMQEVQKRCRKHMRFSCCIESVHEC